MLLETIKTHNKMSYSFNNSPFCLSINFNVLSVQLTNVHILSCVELIHDIGSTA